MIIKTLCDYYDILLEDNLVPNFGFEPQSINYVLVINTNGEIENLISLIDINATKTIYTPMSMKITGDSASPGIDGSKYIFGIDYNKKDKQYFINKKTFDLSKKLYNELYEYSTDIEILSIKSFFNNWNLDSALENPFVKQYLESDKTLTNGRISFKLNISETLICENKEFIDKWYLKNEEKNQKLNLGQDCITGQYDKIAKLHPKIKGLFGGQSTGSALVCCNNDAENSYNFTQSENSRLSLLNAFKYTTTLNYLLRKESSQKKIIGDETIVFGAYSNNPQYNLLANTLFNAILSTSNKDEESEEKIGNIIKNVKLGLWKEYQIDENINFFIIGLSPNGSRISVDFFYFNTLKDFLNKIEQHCIDIKLNNSKKDLSIYQILNGIKGDEENGSCPNSYINALFNSIFFGRLYPQYIYTKILSKIKCGDFISFARTSFIKGFLNRKYRIVNKNEEVLPMALNEKELNKSYLLGRIFAICEKIQKDSLGTSYSKDTKTIRDTYFASACSKPATVFPQILKQTNYRLQKLKYINLEILLTECMSKLDNEFPSFLNYEEQGKFIIGYYQQKEKLYEKKNQEVENNE